ncbi:hypothetical protein EVAR_6720_1 [Eumeta japonica]|uniref:Uncharacterized protein n=1 Tax=Eumeta variegata TaxID=151549 RepID=A0A4C1V514_EUMVA|nr:hypothetical protein EVAR_6720_1 [Eumeta japonica]
MSSHARLCVSSGRAQAPRSDRLVHQTGLSLVSFFTQTNATRRNRVSFAERFIEHAHPTPGIVTASVAMGVTSPQPARLKSQVSQSETIIILGEFMWVFEGAVMKICKSGGRLRTDTARE